MSSGPPTGAAVQTVPSPPPQHISIAKVWQPILLVLAMGWLYHAVLLELGRQWWDDPNFSHGFLVPLFSAFIIWQDRSQLEAVPRKFFPAAIVVIAGSLAMLVVGVLGAELFLSRTSLVFLIAGIVLYFFGPQFFRKVLFAWAFLFLMIPIPAIIFNQITFPLQILASKAATSVLSLIGIPVLRDGNVINLAVMPLEVAEACSGIRSLMSLVTLAVIYGYFLESKFILRALLALAAVPIAVTANASRIVGTGLAVQYWDPEKALGFFHEFSGWVIFVISIVLLLLAHRIIRFGASLVRREAAS